MCRFILSIKLEQAVDKFDFQRYLDLFRKMRTKHL